MHTDARLPHRDMDHPVLVLGKDGREGTERYFAGHPWRAEIENCRLDSQSGTVFGWQLSFSAGFWALQPLQGS